MSLKLKSFYYELYNLLTINVFETVVERSFDYKFRKKFTVSQIVQRFLKPNLNKTLVTAKHIAANGRYSYKILQLIDTNADGRYCYSA